LNEGLHRKLTLISAPAGFGKTTMVTEWLDNVRLEAKKENQIEKRIAWLSLDGGDNDPARFLSYLIAALNQIEGLEATFGKGAQSMLQSPQPPPTEVVLTSLINEIAVSPNKIILILDDYHLIEAQSIHDTLSFLLENIPPQMHLVIATREDPHLPLARLRASGQLTELRAIDLRFTSAEAAELLNQVMGLNLSAEDIAALETRTEGWIAGLQLAAISLQGHADTSRLIQSFTGSNRLVLDYLIEEVLDQQPENIQSFLLQTAILDRLTGSLCNAITGQDNGQQTLEYLEHANLFIVPLDNERRWYRYHHLFADLLRQRLGQSAASSKGDLGRDVDELHRRASIWYEENSLEIEAFQHAAAANDVERAARLVEGDGMPLTLRGEAAPVLKWLASLPTTVLNARPSLWVTYASALNFSGQTAAAEQKLHAAEAALEGIEPDARTNDIVGHIAAIRAMLAIGQNQPETIIAQSRRALTYLHPDNLPLRTTTTWLLAHAYHLQGDRAAASRAYTEVISISQASGNIISTIAGTTGLGDIQESENQLYLAAENYRCGLQLFGDQPQLPAVGAYLGLARVLYEWNDLDAAGQHGQQSIQLARQSQTIDAFANCGVLLARLKITQGDAAGAVAILAEAEQFVRQHNFMHRMPEVAGAQVLTLLHQGDLAAAAHLAEKHELPISQARVHLALGDTATALAVLEPLRRQVEAKGWEDGRLKVMVLQAVALHAHGEKEQAAQLLGEALALAEPGGFIRTFVDEGPPMVRLLRESSKRGIAPTYVNRLLSAFAAQDPPKSQDQAQGAETQVVGSQVPTTPPLTEPLTDRELEVLQLMSDGLTYNEIAAQIMVSLNTVRTHVKNIYSKLYVHKRSQAIARARELNIL
jgi:LuxR family maltose regulon positive regulatory protein